MSGFLDPFAPSIVAEYSRYIDGDLLGKIIAKNFLINVLNIPEKNVHIPVGRYGDASAKYLGEGKVVHDIGDGYVDTAQGKVTIEIKCARINIANRSSGGKGQNWAFVNVTKSPGQVDKTYDVLIAIGVRTLGLEDDQYWSHLKECQASLALEGKKFSLDTRPDEPEYLSICSFFVIPLLKQKKNYFRVNLNAIDKGSRYAEFRAWGYDHNRCKELWQQAVATAKG